MAHRSINKFELSGNFYNDTLKKYWKYKLKFNTLNQNIQQVSIKIIRLDLIIWENCGESIIYTNILI